MPRPSGRAILPKTPLFSTISAKNSEPHISVSASRLKKAEGKRFFAKGGWSFLSSCGGEAGRWKVVLPDLLRWLRRALPRGTVQHRNAVGGVNGAPTRCEVRNFTDSMGMEGQWQAKGDGHCAVYSVNQS